MLAVDSPLKQAVDSVLCSVCHIKPEYFSQILEWVGVVSDVADESASSAGQSATDDVKGSQLNQSLTDDSKADGHRHTLSCGGSFSINAFSESQLSMLATCCQSPVATRHLIDTGLVSALCTGLCLASQRKLYNAFDVEPVVTVSDATKAWNDFNSGPSLSSSSQSHQHQATNSGQSSPISHSGKRLFCCDSIPEVIC